VELNDATCLPGLIDSHTHLTSQTSPTGYSDRFRWNTADYAIRSTVYAKVTLEAGFTTVRNVGDSEYDSVALRNAINAGIVSGPRISRPARRSVDRWPRRSTSGYRGILPASVGQGRRDQRCRRCPETIPFITRTASTDQIMRVGGVLDGSSADSAR
jgi:hypothetical protein